MDGMPPEDRISVEELALRLEGTTGKARAVKAATLAEERAWALQETRLKAMTLAHVDERDRLLGEIGALTERLAKPSLEGEDDPLVIAALILEEAGIAVNLDLLRAALESDERITCPACRGTGRMDNGSQCKVCYGATTVKAPHKENVIGDRSD